MNIAKFLQQFFYGTPPVAANGFFKSLNSHFAKVFNKEISFYDVLIIFSSQHVLDTCLIYKVELVCL